MNNLLESIPQLACPRNFPFPPKPKNLQSVWLKPEHIRVRFLGQNYFEDLNPSDGLKQPEMFYLGTPRKAPQVVLLQGLDAALKARAKDLTPSGLKIKKEAAGLCEAQWAVEFYRTGLDFAQDQIAEFNTAFFADRQLEFILTHLQKIKIAFKTTHGEKREAIFFVYPQFKNNQIEDALIHQLLIEEGPIKVVLEDPHEIQTYAKKLKPLYLAMAQRYQASIRQNP